MSSADEEEIRQAVVARLRALMPAARIVHELNVAGHGSNRIDVAAIGQKAIVAVEIKSRKDTLKRLDDQWAAFSACCHLVLVSAHEKHFVEHREDYWRADVPSELRLNAPGFSRWERRNSVWRFPRPECEPHRYEKPWTFCPVKDVQRQPKAAAMLAMLWASELRSECGRHRLACDARRTIPVMITDMVWNMTGREICEAVCRQLRQRAFVRADAPIIEAPFAPTLSLQKQEAAAA